MRHVASTEVFEPGDKLIRLARGREPLSDFFGELGILVTYLRITGLANWWVASLIERLTRRSA
jgi:hypothetical protein